MKIKSDVSFSIPKQKMQVMSIKYKPSARDKNDVGIVITLANENGKICRWFTPKALYDSREFFNAIGIKRNEYFPIKDSEGNELEINDSYFKQVRLNRIIGKQLYCQIIPTSYSNHITFHIVKFERIK